VRKTAKEIVAARVIAIIRGDYASVMTSIAEALAEGGVCAMEVTMNSPGALGSIEELARRYGESMLIGAGTVMETRQVAQVAQAGARFIVSPDTFPDVIHAALQRDLEPLPGAITPTEARLAVRAGARLIKLFPATLGGPAYLRQIRAPLNDAHFVPTGGITIENAGEYMKAGAVALGVGSTLVSGDFDGSPDAVKKLTERAKRFMEVVNGAIDSA
jgi:2-dehydro-3-deoxyphosphogluconate aldolase / (4S)-4-hydroxy-2-oxoglutarate aldolase